MEANFQRKVTLIREAYCFQLREFSNNYLFGTKIDFEFLSEKSLCSINYFKHASVISFLLALLKHSQAFCGRQFAKFEVSYHNDSFVLSSHKG